MAAHCQAGKQASSHRDDAASAVEDPVTDMHQRPRDAPPCMLPRLHNQAARGGFRRRAVNRVLAWLCERFEFVGRLQDVLRSTCRLPELRVQLTRGGVLVGVFRRMPVCRVELTGPTVVVEPLSSFRRPAGDANGTTCGILKDNELAIS